MADIDYAKLNRQQKLAIFMISIGPEASAAVLKQFDDVEIESLCREMAAFPMVSESVQKLAMEEFAGVVASSVQSATGGIGFVQKTLELAKGDHRASAIIGRVGPVVGTSIEVIKDISEMEGRQIFNLIKHEQPQTISFVLSYLEPAKSAEVFPLLSPDLREEVLERLGTIESTSIDLVNKIVPELIKRGRAPQPGIGIAVADESVAAQLGIAGVVVVGVARGSPAEQAGIRPFDPTTGQIGDVIVEVDGDPTPSLSKLVHALDRAGIGGTVKLTVVRGERRLTLEVKVIDLS